VSVLKGPVQLHAKKNAHRLSFREKRKGCPATGQPSLSRENSSNGGVQNPVKTFWRNLMSRKTGVSRDFYEINPFIFSYLQNQSLSREGVPF
jgi:hypothetical protein